MSWDQPRRVVHVVAAAIVDAGGRILIAQRPEGKHLAGGWEFPGGKLEPGERRVQGLARELHEELGITVDTRALRPLIRVRHAYPTRDVLLDMWVATRFEGAPHGLDGQALRWVTQDEMPGVDLLPADAPIVAALRLPPRLTAVSSPYYSVVDAEALPPKPGGGHAAPRAGLCGALCAGAQEGVEAVAAGADFLVMQAPLADDDIVALCESVPAPVYVRLARLERAWALGATGIHSMGAGGG